MTALLMFAKKRFLYDQTTNRSEDTHLFFFDFETSEASGRNCAVVSKADIFVVCI